MSLGSTLLVSAAALSLSLGWPLPLQHQLPATDFLWGALPRPPAVYGVALASSHKWSVHPHSDQQQQLIPLKQETVEIPADAAQAAAEDAEEAESATDVEDDMQLVVYSFINAPDRPCPDGQYRDAQGICREAW
ncbi:uncharacterized protein LOC126306122 [Schistocerca gregaria]|uniref:uncharacterized protein LOC126306122 n=1 Tax=Schistocerca gregaria TaxID=7010 RepID=UPI00211F14DB|nr:uncharacterized protein LOC126306122 [Schistocerca gregaria]